MQASWLKPLLKKGLSLNDVNITTKYCACDNNLRTSHFFNDPLRKKYTSDHAPSFHGQL